MAKTVLRKKNQAGGITIPDFREYYIATVIKQCGTGTKTDIWINGKEREPEINPHTTVN